MRSNLVTRPSRRSAIARERGLTLIQFMSILAVAGLVLAFVVHLLRTPG